MFSLYMTTAHNVPYFRFKLDPPPMPIIELPCTRCSTPTLQVLNASTSRDTTATETTRPITASRPSFAFPWPRAPLGMPFSAWSGGHGPGMATSPLQSASTSSSQHSTTIATFTSSSRLGGTGILVYVTMQCPEDVLSGCT
ncbi:hypothetical protein OH76DRAFT_371605 [Lentinus brumalis]|uniref:Uncharacterized protein n=1 Tax=Lentinus brumalis TaxID=2498619 RepID=A0A371DEC3_9APHY|nr:hypothetical protein OH76DRAFT_371605 [Polyporus brumalis]